MLATATRSSDVEVGDLQRIFFDELAARFDHVPHQRGEDLIGGHGVLYAYLQQAARFRIDRGIPQLLGVHFTQALEALDLAALLGFLEQPRLRFGEAQNRCSRLPRTIFAPARTRPCSIAAASRTARSSPPSNAAIGSTWVCSTPMWVRCTSSAAWRASVAGCNSRR